MKVIVWCAVLVLVSAEKPKDFTGYKVIDVTPTTEKHVKELLKLQDLDGVDVWGAIRRNSATSILLSPPLYKRVSKQLEALGMTVTLKNSNIQKAIDEEKRGNENARVRARATQTIVNTFPRFDDLNAWLAQQVANNPQISELIDIGTTYEGRTMKVIKIGKPGSRFSTKPSLWIDSGIHAREWLTVSTVVYMIERLLNDYSTNQEVRTLVDTYDWYLLPSANPDGYEYSHTSNRMWRKTRSRTSRWSSCTGVDPNRNFDFHFGESGVNRNPCSDLYPGRYAFSEKCTTNIKNIVEAKSRNMKLFLTIHAHYQMWLTPYAYGKYYPSDYSELKRVAQIGANALKAENGRTFQIGTPPEILYAASGGSYDWAKGVLGIKYAYAFELYPRQGETSNGFIVPQSEIPNSGREIWRAVKAVVNAMQ